MPRSRKTRVTARGTIQHLEGSVYWQKRYERFQERGFTEEESRWAADRNLHLSDERVQRVLLARSRWIQFWRRDHPGQSYAQARYQASRNLRRRNRFYGAQEEEEFLNVFRELSP